jgi:tRNA(Ile)-lysidine synthase
MHALVAQVEAAVRQRGLLAEGAGVLVAVSGGVDSMVLLHALHALAAGQGGRLVVAHFNHRLRGAASEGDARFVERAARRLGLECVVEAGDVRGLARARGWSVEMAARELRHEFLARTAKRLGLGVVALAHHADDQVELFFLRLLRGAGGGLAGMKWRSPSPADKSVMLIRPLLDQPKAALAAFARAKKIRFREDGSNASVDILRNRVRRELLPLLRRRYAPGSERAVLRAMEIVGDEAAFVQAVARGWLRQRRRGPFAELPVAVQRQCVCLELARLGVAAEFELVERLRLQPGVRHSWQDGWLLREAASGRVSVERTAPTQVNPGAKHVELRPARGSVAFADVQVKWQIKPRVRVALVRHAQGCERFDADAVGPRVVLRHWRPGDRFQPSGLARPVKLQDLFTNAKVPARERHRRLVAVAADGRIFWVEGLRISEPFKLGAATRTELVWRWRRAG